MTKLECGSCHSDVEVREEMVPNQYLGESVASPLRVERAYRCTNKDCPYHDPALAAQHLWYRTIG